MESRLDYRTENPAATEAMRALENYVRGSGLEPRLRELVKIRASQINGCAFCMNMHTKEARALGETEQRIYVLNAWRETPFFTEAERAALELTEAVTLIAKRGVPDAVYEQVRQHFSGEQFVALIMVINTINSWNRLVIATKVAPKE